jgi:hypothetical protein
VCGARKSCQSTQQRADPGSEVRLNKNKGNKRNLTKSHKISRKTSGFFFFLCLRVCLLGGVAGLQISKSQKKSFRRPSGPKRGGTDARWVGEKGGGKGKRKAAGGGRKSQGVHPHPHSPPPKKPMNHRPKAKVYRATRKRQPSEAAPKQRTHAHNSHTLHAEMPLA